MHDISILFHPDFTVGYGISPYQLQTQVVDFRVK